jgi:flagellar motility protein MotE (MotC chaperone)
MKKDKASSILALMDPLQAAQILEDLAEQTPVQGIELGAAKP